MLRDQRVSPIHGAQFLSVRVRAAAQAYYGHHVTCPAYIATGKDFASQRELGDTVRTAYQAADARSAPLKQKEALE